MSTIKSRFSRGLTGAQTVAKESKLDDKKTEELEKQLERDHVGDKQCENNADFPTNYFCLETEELGDLENINCSPVYFPLHEDDYDKMLNPNREKDLDGLAAIDMKDACEFNNNQNTTKSSQINADNTDVKTNKKLNVASCYIGSDDNGYPLSYERLYETVEI